MDPSTAKRRYLRSIREEQHCFKKIRTAGNQWGRAERAAESALSKLKKCGDKLSSCEKAAEIAYDKKVLSEFFLDVYAYPLIVCKEDNYITLMPEEIVIRILKHLSAIDIMNVGSLSPDLYRISKDESLWRNVSFNVTALTRRILSVICDNYLNASTKSLRLKGSSHEDVFTKVYEVEVDRMLQKCSQVEYLTLEKCRFLGGSGMNLGMLNLRSTSLTHLWLKCVKFGDHDITGFPNLTDCTRLTHLRITNTSVDAYELQQNIFPTLQVLEIGSGCLVKMISTVAVDFPPEEEIIEDLHNYSPELDIISL